jgi:hypothetical protein
MRGSLFIPLAAMSGCGEPAQRDQNIIDASWAMEADYQRTSRDNLERDLIAKVRRSVDERCVVITAKPGNDIMGGDSTYCFDGRADVLRSADRPIN